MITGIRASLETASNIKRNASAVVDAVSAEDVGKLPDSDVGQALGRIPGISVGRAFGQGAAVSIRGTDPQMTYTTLNGQTIASTGWYDQLSLDRSFNYSLLPPELIGGMEVYKSSQANLTEGGIGGTVIVKTRKPLDMDTSAIVSAKLGKGTVSTDLNKTVSGLFNYKDPSKRFGVMVAGALEDGDYLRRGTESFVGWGSSLQNVTFLQKRERKAFNVALQARPTAALDFNLNYLKLDLAADNGNTNHYIFQNGAADICTKKNVDGTCIASTATKDKTNPAFVETWARSASMASESLNLNGSFKGEGFKVDGTVGTTKATGGTKATTNFGYFGGKLPVWTGSVDQTGKQVVVSPSSAQDVDVSMFPSKVAPSGAWATSRSPNTDKETYAQLDLSKDLNWGALSAFKAGARTTTHTFQKRQERSVMDKLADANGQPILDKDGKLQDILKDVDTAGLYSGTHPQGSLGWNMPKPNIGAMFDGTYQSVVGWIEQRPGRADLEEKNNSLYGMFEFDQDKLRGNFGLRYINTKVSSSAYKFDATRVTQAEVFAKKDVAQNDGWSRTLSTDKASYSDWLPSFNAAYELDRNSIVRFAAAKAITRPNFDNMFYGSQGGFGDNDPTNQSITFGDPGLKPMKSNQFDLSYEFYYGRGNMVSIGAFYKSISNFVSTKTLVNQKIGVADPVGGDNWTVNRYINAGGGKIKGIEAQINHNFGGGFGTVANYTYSDATAPAASFQDELNVFTGSSKHNVNLVGYYETDSYSGRLAYNWRSKYMVRETGWYGNRMHDPIGSLDLSLGWNVTKDIKLGFEAINLLKSDDVQYGAAGSKTTVKPELKNGYPAWSYKGEITYRFGVTAKF
ncbi:MAG: TonB-dependent receptor [Rubrivivax sp.]